VRLAFITSSFPPYTSGVGINAATITSGLADLGHEIHVFLPEYPEQQVRSHPLVSPKLYFHFVPSLTNPFKKTHRLFTPSPVYFFKALSEVKPDIIHLQEPQLHIFSSIKLYSQMQKRPLVCAHHFPPEFITNQIHPEIVKPLVTWLVMKSIVSLYNQSQEVITPTHAMENLLRNYGLKTPVSVISNGVDTKRFRPPGKQRNKQGSILYFGRLDFDKNLDTLIQAAKLINNGYEIWFAGSGKAENYLKNLAKKLQLNNQIKFLGYVPETEKPKIYQQASIFVMPSTAEAQSIVSLEAAASGLPLVLANAAALPELISPTHPNGLLFTPKNPHNLADTINQILASHQKLTAFGKNSRLLSLTHETSMIIKSYESTYLNLLQ